MSSVTPAQNGPNEQSACRNPAPSGASETSYLFGKNPSREESPSFTEGVHQSHWESAKRYATSMGSASSALAFVFRDLMLKSRLQTGVKGSVTHLQGMQEGAKAVPTIGLLIVGQMSSQPEIEKRVAEKVENKKLAFATSCLLVGGLSALPLAVINGRSQGLRAMEAFRRMTPAQFLVNGLGEAGFNAGMTGKDHIAQPMKQLFGDHKAVEYLGVAASAAAGSVISHVPNTCATRWQAGLKIDHPSQLMLGLGRRTYGVTKFAVAYKLGIDLVAWASKNP